MTEIQARFLNKGVTPQKIFPQSKPPAKKAHGITFWEWYNFFLQNSAIWKVALFWLKSYNQHYIFFIKFSIIEAIFFKFLACCTVPSSKLYSFLLFCDSMAKCWWALSCYIESSFVVCLIKVKKKDSAKFDNNNLVGACVGQKMLK